MSGKPYAPPALEDITLEQIATAILEVRRLRERVDELLGANTREVERRRRVEVAANGLLEVIRDPFGDITEARVAALRRAINACPRCGALSGEPCRTDNVAAALPTPHEERGQP